MSTVTVSPRLWDFLQDEGKIFDITKYTKNMGVTMQVAITSALFSHLHPWAEDIAAGESYEERISQMIEGFKKAFRDHDQPYGEFFMKLTSSVKSIENPEKDKVEAKTFAKGKKTDKVLECFCGLFPKGKRVGIIFGVKGEKEILIKEGPNVDFQTATKRPGNLRSQV